MKYQELEKKIDREIEEYNQDLADPYSINEILEGIDDLDDEKSPSEPEEPTNLEPLDPLERIDREEKEISKNKEYHDLESKFVLSNNIANINTQKFNNILYETNVSLSEKLYSYYGDKNKSIQAPLGSNFGIPKCITVFYLFLILCFIIKLDLW